MSFDAEVEFSYLNACVKATDEHMERLSVDVTSFVKQMRKACKKLSNKKTKVRAGRKIQYARRKAKEEQGRSSAASGSQQRGWQMVASSWQRSSAAFVWHQSDDGS